MHTPARHLFFWHKKAANLFFHSLLPTPCSILNFPKHLPFVLAACKHHCPSSIHNFVACSHKHFLILMFFAGNGLYRQFQNRRTLQHLFIKFPLFLPGIVFHDHSHTVRFFLSVFQDFNRSSSHHTLVQIGKSASHLPRHKLVSPFSVFICIFFSRQA